jgi:hypothetical protein
MAATAKAVPDEAIRWWETFSKGFTGDQGEEEVDSDFESVAEGERNAGDGQTAAAAHARVAREGSSARHGQGKKRGFSRLQHFTLISRSDSRHHHRPSRTARKLREIAMLGRFAVGEFGASPFRWRPNLT